MLRFILYGLSIEAGRKNILPIFEKRGAYFNFYRKCKAF